MSSFYGMAPTISQDNRSRDDAANLQHAPHNSSSGSISVGAEPADRSDGPEPGPSGGASGPENNNDRDADGDIVLSAQADDSQQDAGPQGRDPIPASGEISTPPRPQGDAILQATDTNVQATTTFSQLENGGTDQTSTLQLAPSHTDSTSRLARQGQLGLLVAAAEAASAQPRAAQELSASLRNTNASPSASPPRYTPSYGTDNNNEPRTASRVSIHALLAQQQQRASSVSPPTQTGVGVAAYLPLSFTGRSVSSPQLLIKTSSSAALASGTTGGGTTGIASVGGATRVGRHKSRPQPIQPVSASSRRAAPYPLQSASLHSALGTATATSTAASFRTPTWLSAMSSVSVDGGSGASASSSAPATPPLNGRCSPQITSPRMSMSHKRTPPAWPSPKFPSSSSGGSAAVSSARPPLVTPAALRIPPTPQYSPAFHRSGYDGPSVGSSSSSSSAAGPGPHRESLPSASAPNGRYPVPTPRMAGGSRMSLAGVPQGYIIRQLNALAPKFWNSPGTTDCSIVVPVPRKHRGGSPPSAATTTAGNQAAATPAESVHSAQPGRSYWPPTPLAPGLPSAQPAAPGADVITSRTVQRGEGGRRGSLPTEGNVPVLIFPLHKDYLITQSTLFRSLLAAGAPGLNLDPPMTATPGRDAAAAGAGSASAPLRPPMSARATPSGSSTGPKALRGARVLPTKDGEPTAVYVPLPDPGSFGVIVHWLYWGDVSALETALNRGLVTWQGVVKNIEYLALDDSVKRVMGKWWRRWVKTDVGRQRTAAAAATAATGASGLAAADAPASSRLGDDEDDDDQDEMNGMCGRRRSGWRGDASDSDGDVADEEDEAMDIEAPSRPPADDHGVSGLLQAL